MSVLFFRAVSSPWTFLFVCLVHSVSVEPWRWPGAAAADQRQRCQVQTSPGGQPSLFTGQSQTLLQGEWNHFIWNTLYLTWAIWVSSMLTRVLLSLNSLQENTHRLTLSMSPDEAYLEKQAQAEEDKLQSKIQALSHSDRKEIYENGNDGSTDDGNVFLYKTLKLSITRVLLERSGAAGCSE